MKLCKAKWIADYRAAIAGMMKYEPGQVGVQVYAERAADMSEAAEAAGNAAWIEEAEAYEMKRYYVRNVLKAAKLALQAQEAEGLQCRRLRLNLISGIHGGRLKEVEYRTAAGLIRNSGRKVVAWFFVSRSEFGIRRSRIQFEATF